MTSTASAAPLFCGLVIHGGVSQLALIGGRPTVDRELTPNGAVARGGEGSGGVHGRRCSGSPVMRHDGTTLIDHAY